MKAYLVSKEVQFPKIHNLLRLSELCKQTDGSFENLRDKLVILNDYAIEMRYPDDWFEPNSEDAKEAFDLARKIKKFVLEKIGLTEQK